MKIAFIALLVLGLLCSCRREPTPRPLTVALLPKNKGNPYFIAARQGATTAAKELGIKLLWDGPTDTDPAKQNEVVEAWLTRGVDVIAVSVENREGIATVLRKARAHGVKVVTWDADTAPDARDLFVNQATPDGIAETLVHLAARLLGGRGKLAIITASLTAANQNTWIALIKDRLAAQHPGLQLVAVRPSDDKQDVAFTETQNLLKLHPDLGLVMAVSSPAVPGAAEAVKQAGRAGVKVIGLSLPSSARRYLKDGTVSAVVLWDVGNLGYLTVHTARALARGELPGSSTLTAGRMGAVQVRGSEVLLGTPLVIDAANVDQFSF